MSAGVTATSIQTAKLGFSASQETLFSLSTLTLYSQEMFMKRLLVAAMAQETVAGTTATSLCQLTHLELQS